MSKDTVERFSDRVGNYVKYRPHYPKEILEMLKTDLGFSRSSVVADIGSGTGISARLFVENGNKVYGVEPNHLMRNAAETYLQEFPNFTNVDGTAENTTLADKSVDIVVAAQAFHWFNHSAARKEFRRILKPGGNAILIWNERELDSNEFLIAYEKILVEFGTDYEQVRHENVTKEVLEDSFAAKFEQRVFDNSQTLDFEGMKGRILSASYMPAADHPRFDELVEKLKTLFAEHQKNDRIQVLYKTNIFYTQY